MPKVPKKGPEDKRNIVSDSLNPCYEAIKIGNVGLMPRFHIIILIKVRHF